MDVYDVQPGSADACPETGVEEGKPLRIVVGLAHDRLAPDNLIGETVVISGFEVPCIRREDRNVTFPGKPRGICVRHLDDAVYARVITVNEKAYVHVR